MKYYLTFTLLIVFTFFFSVECKAWGLLGHRVVGEVASKHLNETARHKVQGILGNRTLAEVSNWMDEIKSDKKRSEEHTSELQSRPHLVCRLLLEKKKKKKQKTEKKK